jgi:putative transposase
MVAGEARLARNAEAVFSLKYHLVFCPKYRRPVLTSPIDARLKELVREIANNRDMTLHAFEVMPDHVHMFIESDPRWAPAEIAARFKAVTSRVLREEFPTLRTRLPTLWSRSYFIASVGGVSEAMIRRFIGAQKGR